MAAKVAKYDAAKKSSFVRSQQVLTNASLATPQRHIFEQVNPEIARTLNAPTPDGSPKDGWWDMGVATRNSSNGNHDTKLKFLGAVPPGAPLVGRLSTVSAAYSTSKESKHGACYV
jgi:hypothetical protein